MHYANVDKDKPGQRSGYQQQAGGDQFGCARSRRRRFDRVIVVMAVTIAGMGMVVMRLRRMRVRTMRIVVMLDGIAARIARMRPEDRDQPREDGADQRQKDDDLNHRRASLRMISEQTRMFVRENRLPLFRIMLSPSSD